MGNSFVDTVKVVGDKMLEFLDGYSDLASRVDRSFEGQFEMSKESYGNSINVPKPPRYASQDGPVISSVSTINISTIPVVLDKWKNVTISLSALDRNYNAKEFDAWAEKYLKPMVSPLINDVDTSLFQLYKKVANHVGTPGTGFGTTATTAIDLLGAAKEKLDYSNTPKERICYLNPTGSRKFAAAMGTNYNPVQAVGTMIKDGKPFTTEGFELYESTNVAIHTTGSAAPVSGTILTNLLAGQTGASLLIDTMTPSTVLLPGDVLNFTGYYEVNPTSGKSTGTLKDFVVLGITTQASTSCTITVDPPFIPSGPFKNVTGAAADVTALADGIVVICKAATTAGNPYVQQLAFWPKALGLVCVPIKAPEGLHPTTRSYNGLSITLTTGSDIFQYAEYFRADIAWGTAMFYPENCVRITN